MSQQVRPDRLAARQHRVRLFLQPHPERHPAVIVGAADIAVQGLGERVGQPGITPGGAAFRAVPERQDPKSVASGKTVSFRVYLCGRLYISKYNRTLTNIRTNCT